MKFWRSDRRGFLVGIILAFIFLIVPDYPLVNAVTSSTDGWTRLSDPLAVGGVITRLVAAPSNPNILYALQGIPLIFQVSQRLYRSEDDGASWQMVPDENHAFSSLAVDPQNPDTLYATENDQLWKSANAGLNWTMLYPFGKEVVVPVPGRIYLVGQVLGGPCVNTSEFARSLDGGETWERSSLGCGEIIDQIFVAPANPDQIFVTSSAKALNDYSSLDGGITWQPLLIDESHIPVTGIAFDLENPDRAYLASREIWMTENNGDTWSKCGPIPETYSLNLLAVGNRVYAVPRYPQSAIDPTRYVYQSEDHCATWWKSIHGLPATVNSLVGDIRSPGRLLAATGGYGIFTSTNGGATWQESNTGLTSPAVISKLAVAPSDPNVILAGSWYPRPGVYRSADGGITWSPALLAVEPLSILIHPFDPLKAWIGAKDGIYYTEDGLYWTHEYAWSQVTNLAGSPSAPNSPFAASAVNKGGFILRREINQPSEYWIPYPISGSIDIQTLAVNPWDADDLMAGGTAELIVNQSNPVIYRSQDGGVNWHVVSSSFWIVDIAIDPNHPQNRYALTYKEGIKRSTDSGETWIDWSGGIDIKTISSSASLAVDDFGGVYAFIGDTINYRAGDDADWQIIPQDFQSSSIGTLWRGDAPFLLSAGMDGLWKLDLPPVHKTWLPVLSK